MTTKMADDAGSPCVETSEENPCFIHFPTVTDVELKPFSDKAWNTTLQYADIWKNYDIDRAQITRNFIQRVTRASAQSSDTACTSTSNTQLCKPSDARFHRKCYQKFTDKVKAKLCEKKRKTPSEIPSTEITEGETLFLKMEK